MLSSCLTQCIHYDLEIVMTGPYIQSITFSQRHSRHTKDAMARKLPTEVLHVSRARSHIFAYCT